MDQWTHLFHSHVNKFMTKMNMTPSKGCLLAVSGGVDSMVLFHFFRHWCEKNDVNLRVAVVHHGTREGQDEDCKLVRTICKLHDIDCVVHYEKKLSLKNFEAQARVVRYRFFHNTLEAGESLVLGHHLNDSFEWYLMHQFKSSNIKILGIAAQGGRLIRPFMCVSKKHIRKYAKINRVEFREDETNSDLSYERNNVRHIISDSIEPNYPQYLKHYVARMNQIVGIGYGAQFVSYSRSNCALVPANNIATYIPNIVDVIHRLSDSNRGKLHGQISKIENLIDSNKWGPLTFSGGVHVYYKDNFLFFHKKAISESRNISSLEITFKSPGELKSYLKCIVRSHPEKFPFWMKIKKTTFALEYQKQPLSGFKKLIKSEKELISGHRLLQQWVKRTSGKHQIIVEIV